MTFGRDAAAGSRPGADWISHRRPEGKPPCAVCFTVISSETFEAPRGVLTQREETLQPRNVLAHGGANTHTG